MIVLSARAPYTRRADLVLGTYMHDWEERPIALERAGRAPYADTRVVAYQASPEVRTTLGRG